MDEEEKTVKRKNVLKIVFSVLALVLLIITYVSLKNINEKKENEEKTAEEILSIPAENVEKISFSLDEQTVTFEKQDDKWIYADDKNFPVDEEKLQETVDGLESITSDKELKDVDDLSEYGLKDNSGRKIEIYTTEGEKRTIQIGDMNTTTQSYYAIIDDIKDTVYMIESSFVSLYEGNLYDYAEAGTFPVISSNEIDEIQVKKSDSSYTLKISSEVSSGWMIETENVNEEADSSAASQAATSINSLSYLDFIDYNCEDYSKYGLENPEAEILVKYHQEVELKEEDSESDDEETKIENKEILLKIGNKEDNNYYVCVDGSREIYTMSNDSLENLLGKTVSDYWNLKVNYYSITDLKSMSVEHGGVKDVLSIEKKTDEDGEGEELYYVNGEEAEEDSFKNFFNGVVNISAKERLEETYQADGDPEWKFIFENEDAREEVSYYIFDENFYVAVKDNGTSYLINKLDVTNLDNLLKVLKNGGDGGEEQ